MSGFWDFLNPVEIVEVPLFRAGRHLDPRRGASLTEVAALATGDVWTDRPAAIHPTLARVARFVNDHTSDPARASLQSLLPGLVGTGCGTDRARRHTLRASVVAAARTAVGHPTSPTASAWRLYRMLGRAERELLAQTTPGPERDTRLSDLLESCIAAARIAGAMPAMTRQLDVQLPPSVVVRTSLIHERGCDWTTLVCTPLEPLELQLKDPITQPLA